jgi:hypothetical protein
VRFENGTFLRSLVSIVAGLLLGVSIPVGGCFASYDACEALTKPAVLILQTGFEGGLVALAATCLFLWVVFSICIWFILRKWGPFRRVFDREDS